MINISVIIIIKDDHRVLECALRSFNDVDYPKENFEVIVVDDGSKIPVQEVVQFDNEYALTIHYLARTKSSSRSRARNVGGRKAKFEYLMFMDGDHIVQRDILKKYNRYFELKPTKPLVLGTRREFHESLRNTIIRSFLSSNSLSSNLHSKSVQDIRLYVLALYDCPLSHIHGRWHLFWSCNFCIKRDLFEKIGMFDEAFIEWGFEDVEFGYRLCEGGYDFEIIDNYIWHISPAENINADKYSGWLKNLLYFYKKYRDVKILMQFEFENTFYYNSGVSDEAHPLDKNWIHSFKNFERKLCYLDQNKSLLE